MTSPLDRGHVERRGAASAERDVRGISRIGGIAGRIPVESDLEGSIGQWWMGQSGGGGGGGRWDHHPAGDVERSSGMPGM